ncbi:MAG: ATP-dependent DNA helicase RecG [Lachnospiraceae bacterium]|nr:ATP-dependent DNA helicase RecG [Lachnospiraceae bacterium]
MLLNDDITKVKGIGDKTKDGFYALGLKTVDDLIHYYPRTYEKFEYITSIDKLIYSERNAVYARVIKSPAIVKLKGKTMITAYVTDSSERVLEIKYFNAPYLVKTLKKDSYHVFRGYVRCVKDRILMSQPRMYSLDDYKKIEGTIGPIYTVNKDLTNARIEKSVKYCLENSDYSNDFIKNEELAENNLLSLKDAIYGIHFPSSVENLSFARKRLVFDEFLSFLYMIRSNEAVNKRKHNPEPMIEVADLKILEEKLPYQLTNSQKEAISDVVKDMSSEYLMNRLIQGDVGSGKTIVAIMALLMSAANGKQGVMMAPTDVLARQHFSLIKEMSNKYKLCIKPVLLVGKLSAKDRREALSMIESGDANVIIGTHAVFQDKVVFKNLALIITDEQHRFGVEQRKMLREKGENPHILVMSATPIPRTLAMIIFADLDISIMKDMPKNRIPISNCVVNSGFRNKAMEFIGNEIKKGHQVYVICPMIDESEADNFNLKNVFDEADEIKDYFKESVNVSILHGKMKPDEKTKVMEDFKDHKSDILVSTTVIEVGIDVPNATVILIENSERFGLSQLHQLRGRVGRSDIPSYCIMMSDDDKPETQKRLKVLNDSNDGFEIAKQDMKLRGPGELSGVRQSGDLSFAMGDVVEDSEIMILADSLFDSFKDRLNDRVSNIVDFRTI